MEFLSPEWFLLFPAILLLGYVVKRLRVFRPIRLLLLAVMTLILTRPVMDTLEDALDLWVLFDVSESTEDLVSAHSGEWEQLLARSKPNRNSQMLLMNYAGDALKQERGSETEEYSGSRKLTRTRLALEHVAALASDKRPSRVLLFTDGYSTEPLAGVVAKFNAMGIPIDYRLVREDLTDDYRVARIDLPTRVQIREPFVLGVTVRGFQDGKVPLRIYQNGKIISRAGAQVEIINGVGKSEFTVRLQNAGSYEFTAQIQPENDVHLGNNKAIGWVEVAGGAGVLLVSKYENDPIAQVLRAQGMDVKVVSDGLTLKVGQLSGVRAVIFNNVPAHEVDGDFLAALEFFVHEQGGGFMMVGGARSFGSGGYFESAVDPLLPISMELKEDQRKLAVAMAFVLDRSGSMAASAGKGTKMDLANTGTEKAIELLGAQDSVAVYAVDSDTHVIVKQQQILGNKKKMVKRVRKIKSQGGGIYVYTGLKDAWKQLKKVPIETRHIILFADAADAEEPGGYKKLLEQMNDKGATISVIGLGSRKDVDAKFLEDIAKRGKGRIFFTNKPMEIPKLFAQETVTLARSAFLSELTAAQATGHWTEVSPKPMDWLPAVGGYNLSYLRDGATVSLVSKDEYVAPLVAQARRGLGRTVAVAFPLGGEHSTETRNWQKYGDFVQTLTRWIMRSDLPPGIGLRHRMEGTRMTIDLMYDTDDWSERFAKNVPEIKIISDDSETGERVVRDLQWRRISPGHFSLSYELSEGHVVRGAVKIGDQAVPFGPIVVGASAEWAFDGDRVTELRQVSKQTGGRELLDLSEAWLRPEVERQADLRLPLAIAALVILLLDALVTRIGWQMPKFGKVSWPQRGLRSAFAGGESAGRSKIKSAKIKKAAPAEKPKSTAEIPTAQQKDSAPKPAPKANQAQRRSRYKRAKK